MNAPHPSDLRPAAAGELRLPGAFAWDARGRTEFFGALFRAVTLGVPALWSIGYLFPPLNHDAALILDVAGRWLDGFRLYVDVIDVNPPLIFALSLIPELASRCLGIASGTAFTLAVLLLAAGSLLLAGRVLRASPGLFGPVQQNLLLPLLAFLLIVYPDDMFGQREHLMLIASMPYLLAATARGAGSRLPGRLLCVVMALAGFGFALKPHFLLAPCLIELALIIAARRICLRDPALWALSLGPAVQVFLILFVTPEYLTEIVPLGLRLYVEQGEAMWGVATGSLIGPTLAVLVLLGGMAVFVRGMRLPRVASLYVLAGAVAAVVQAKGWSYQSLPATAGCVLLVFSVLATVIDRYVPAVSARRGALAIACALLMACYYHGLMMGLPFEPQRNFATSDTGRLHDIVWRQAYDHKLLIVSPGVLPHFPMVNYAGVQLVGRFESMWVLQGVYASCGRAEFYNPPSRMSADEKRIFDGLAVDFSNARPSLVIIDRDAGIPDCDRQAFDYLDYFGRNSLFAATLAEYDEIAGFDRYRIFRRNPQIAAAEFEAAF